jgi:hypothetical protein
MSTADIPSEEDTSIFNVFADFGSLCGHVGFGTEITDSLTTSRHAADITPNRAEFLTPT